MVRRSRWYWHHAIDLGDGTVVHYAGGRGDTRVVAREPWDAFALGGQVVIRQHRAGLPADLIVARALDSLGEHRYSLVRNNCEHLATWCSTARRSSSQVRAYTAASVHSAVIVALSVLHDSELIVLGMVGMLVQRLRRLTSRRQGDPRPRRPWQHTPGAGTRDAGDLGHGLALARAQ